MGVPALPANPTTARQLPPPTPHRHGGLAHFFKRLVNGDTRRMHNGAPRSVEVRLLSPDILFSTTAIVYHGTKIFLLDTFLIRNVYKIIKLLKRIFAFADKDNKFLWRAMLTDQKARHVLLKVTYNCSAALEGAYDLLTRNEIVKMAYASMGLGATWQPFSAAWMSRIEFCLTPVVCLKWATKTSHFFIATRNVWKLNKNTPHETRYANWVILGKAALDFGIESLRLSLHIAGVATGSTYMLVFSLSFLGIISNSFGMVKQVFPIKGLAEGKYWFVMVQAPPPPPPTAQAAQPPPARGS